MEPGVLAGGGILARGLEGEGDIVSLWYIGSV